MRRVATGSEVCVPPLSCYGERRASRDARETHRAQHVACGRQPVARGL